MRSLAIVFLLVAGACGGAASATKPRPAGSERGAQVVAVVERAADRVCRCKSGACADAAVARMGAGLQAREDTMLTVGEQSAMVHAVARLDRCRGRLIRRGEQAARVAERWADETCACADDACRELASRRGADELRRYGDAQATDDEVRRIVVASRRVRRCLAGDDAAVVQTQR
jgi:hypothetical protein